MLPFWSCSIIHAMVAWALGSVSKTALPSSSNMVPPWAVTQPIQKPHQPLSTTLPYCPVADFTLVSRSVKASSVQVPASCWAAGSSTPALARMSLLNHSAIGLQSLGSP